jgi:hypothetical protein
LDVEGFDEIIQKVYREYKKMAKTSLKVDKGIELIGSSDK